MPAEPASDRTRVKRLPERGRYDRETVHGILDEALICHVGFVTDGQPFVIPTIHARDGETLYLHGSPASRMLRTIGAGIAVCVTATLLDGLVLARSVFHHSMNYRSAVILGRATLVNERSAKLAAMDVLVDRVMPGRRADSRSPNETEIKGTTILRVPLDESSAKVRSGPPEDDEDDLALNHWAGVVPLAMAVGQPEPAPDLDPSIGVPDYIREYRRP